jgi:hypothetical protein
MATVMACRIIEVKEDIGGDSKEIGIEIDDHESA